MQFGVNKSTILNRFVLHTHAFSRNNTQNKHKARYFEIGELEKSHNHQNGSRDKSSRKTSLKFFDFWPNFKLVRVKVSVHRLTN